MTYVGSSWTELGRWENANGYGYTTIVRLVAKSTQDGTTNASRIDFQWQKAITGGSAYWDDAHDYAITTDGHTANMNFALGTVNSQNFTDVGPSDYWANVAHASDGTCTVSFTATGYYYWTSGTLTGTIELPQIPQTPTAPTTCVATGSDGVAYIGENVTISFGGATGTITGYEWQYRTNGESWNTYTRTVTGSPITDSPSGLSMGDTIQYRVRAMNGSLASDWKVSNTLTFYPRTPSAPTNCTLTGDTDGVIYTTESVSVSWSGATGRITGYEWQSSSNNGSTWSASTAVSGTTISDIWPASTASGSTVKYRVRAMNGTSASAWTTSNALIVYPRTPSAPSVTITDGNEGTVYNGEMIWAHWSGAVGRITGYEYQTRVNGGAWSASASTQDAEIYQAIPDNTTSLQYRVRAKNGSYASAWATSNTLTVASNSWPARVLSGTLNTNKYNGDIGLTLTWTATQSVANNTSTISWKLASNGSGASSWWNAGPVTVKINGTTVLTITSRFKLYGGGAWSKTGSLTITHNSDGSKSFSASISAAIYSTAVNCTASGTFTLNPIARTPSPPASCTITAGNGNYVGLGDQVTISWSGAAGVITGYDLQYLRGSSGWTTFKSVTSTSTSGSTTDVFTSTDIATNGAGNAVQYRVRAKNGSLTSAWTTSNTLTISGAMDIKVSGAWKTGSVWIKVAGTWKRAKRIWINVNGTWKQSK